MERHFDEVNERATYDIEDVIKPPARIYPEKARPSADERN